MECEWKEKALMKPIFLKMCNHVHDIERQETSWGGEQKARTCRIAPEFANFRGRDTVSGSVSAAKSAKSIEDSPRKPDFEDPCKNLQRLDFPATYPRQVKDSMQLNLLLTVETIKWQIFS